jgi:prepilin signal peptidase PulO-like enzyme (type II secretory pathway)
MFDYVWTMKIGYVLCGIIWSFVCGISIGNYACSMVHRLPRGRLMLDKPPYCGSCGTLLKTVDLFPVFSAVLLRHKCRYCKTPFPVSHTWTEFLVGLLFVLLFFKYGYGESFVLIGCISVFFITLAAIETNENMIMGKILLCIAVAGAINRAMLDGGIYNLFYAALYALVIAVVLWRKQVKKVGHIYTMPPQAWLFVAGALCVGALLFQKYLIVLAAFSATFYLFALIRRKPFKLSIPLGLATTLILMYPSINFY